MKKLSLIIAILMVLSACASEPRELSLQIEGDQGVTAYPSDQQEVDPGIEVSGVAALPEPRPFGPDENYPGVYYGQFEAEGYASIVQVKEPFCEEDCKTYDYVFFTLTQTENPSISSYIQEGQGNSFISQNGIGLGCLEAGKIIYSNMTDVAGNQNHTLDETTSTAIINSTQEAPIRLKITRELYTSGMGAPACYSHFGEVELVQN